MKTALCLASITLLLAASNLSAATLYVSLESTNSTPPYTNWATAATSIQDAVDTAKAGDTVLVTDGVYAEGEREAFETQDLPITADRLAITNAISLLSLNGPQFTVIDGGGTIRCVSLGDGASLTGFTLSNGVARFGGGVWCPSTNAFLTNCTLTGNSANGCGGGALGGTLNNCTLAGNSAAGDGGGAYGGALYNCRLSGNTAQEYGGGAAICTLYNCTLSGNSAQEFGGGAGGCTLYNCTLSGNTAQDYGGGAYSCMLKNSIVYFNAAPYAANYASCTLNYCCTTPPPPTGVGNISLDPQLASASHLSANSPCRGVGSAAYAIGTDIDGEPWANPPSIGCNEYRPGSVTGPLTVGLVASYTNVAVGFPPAFTALIEGPTTESVWDFGDGDVAINQPYVTHAWTRPGDYLVALWAFNESHSGGVSASVTVRVEQEVRYVAAGNANPLPPYTNWATAAVTIQDAVEAATTGPGDLVLVTNGLYATGGRAMWGGTMTNRVAVDKPVAVRSVNGPQFTIIQGAQTRFGGGDGAIRCVYPTNGASLSGFTLTNGATQMVGDIDRERSGGGVWCEATAVVSNCVVTHNWAGEWAGGAYGGTLNNCTLTVNSASYGGGASGCTLNQCTLADNFAAFAGAVCWATLNDCTLTGNFAWFTGGGAYGCAMNNCTLAGNSAKGDGGGAYDSTLDNCIVYFNTPVNWSAHDSLSTLNYCCTTPLPTQGVGNITNAPLFVDYTNGNLRLQSNSPCINAGNNAYVTTATDLDGNPRIVGGTVDIGAYEYQGTGSAISYAWLQQYGLPTDGSVDYADLDGSGFNVYQDWIAGLNPTNRLSVLRFVSVVPQGTNVAVTWQSVAGISYFLGRSTNLASPFALLATNIIGQGGTTTYADTNATGAGRFFYRVGVKGP